jgi:hypothetical protein
MLVVYVFVEIPRISQALYDPIIAERAGCAGQSAPGRLGRTFRRTPRVPLAQTGVNVSTARSPGDLGAPDSCKRTDDFDKSKKFSHIMQ